MENFIFGAVSLLSVTAHYWESEFWILIRMIYSKCQCHISITPENVRKP